MDDIDYTGTEGHLNITSESEVTKHSDAVGAALIGCVMVLCVAAVIISFCCTVCSNKPGNVNSMRLYGTM